MRLTGFIVVLLASCASKQGPTARIPAGDKPEIVYDTCIGMIDQFLSSSLGFREGGALHMFVGSVSNEGKNPVTAAFPVLNRDYVSHDGAAVLRVSVVKSDRATSTTNLTLTLGKGASAEVHTFEIDPIKEGARILNGESRTVRVISSSDGVCEISKDACTLKLNKVGKDEKTRSVVLSIAGREPIVISGLRIGPTTPSEIAFAALIDAWGREGPRQFNGVTFVDRELRAVSWRV